MENQINAGDQNTQQIGQNPVSQPMQLMEKPKVNYWMIITFVLLIILVVGGMYTFNLAAKFSNSKNANKISPTTNTEPTPITTVTASPTNNVVWKTQIIPIQHESAFLGSKTVNLEMKIPTDWTIQTSQITTDLANSTIKNCSISTIISKDQSMKATFAPICTGWSAQYSVWPGDTVIALQQKRGGNDGLHNFYRVRVTSSVNNYNYVDAMTEPDRPLDKNKDQVMDALLIGYAPPNESKDDFFFIAAHLTANYSGQTSARDNFLSVVDQIAASITLK